MHLDFPAIFSVETRSALLLPPMYTHSSREVDKVVLAEEKKLAPDNSNCNLGETKLETPTTQWWREARMESTSRPSVFSRLGMDTGRQQGTRTEEEERMVERGRREEGEERRRRQGEGERRSDEGGRRGVRESPQKRGRDLGLNRRGSPIKKVINCGGDKN